MKLKDKLHAYWSRKERDVIIAFPVGQSTSCDAHWLAGMLAKEVTAELDRRGYDVNTLKFSIEPKKGEQRFASQRSAQ